MDTKDVLVKGLDIFGLEYDADRLNLLLAFWSRLRAANELMNLISAKQDEKTQVLIHLLDSLTPLRLPELNGVCTALDIGSGGGLPALPLKIFRPGWQYILVEATAKKARFLLDTIAFLELPGVEVINCYLTKRPEERQKRFDLITARAVAALAVLAALAGPRLAAGGYFLALKGPKAAEELSEAEGILKKEKLVLRRSLAFNLPLNGAGRVLLLFQKM